MNVNSSPILCEEISRILIGLNNNEYVNAVVSGSVIPTIDLNKTRSIIAKVNDNDCAADEIEISAILASLLRTVAADKASLNALMNIYIDAFKRCTKEDISSNPYYKKIKFNNCKSGDFELSHGSYEPGKLFVVNEFLTQEPNPFTYARSGYAAETIEFPVLKENGNVWMSITPNEINTMKRPIDRAVGNVVTLGCGLGYFAYMAHLKSEVTNVTIVEKDENVLKMFSELILPQFDYPEKITIIQEDALKWVDKLEDGRYNYMFCDIWQNATDGIYAYSRIKTQEKRFKKTKISYWVEKSIIHAMKLAFVVPELEFALMSFKNNIAGLSNTSAIEMHDAQIKAYTHNIHQYEEIKKLFDEQKISSVKDLKNILSTDYIKRLIKNADWLFNKF